MQSILAGAVVTLFLFALYVPWFTNTAMLAAILGSFLINLFLMAGTLEILPDNVSLLVCNPLYVPYASSTDHVAAYLPVKYCRFVYLCCHFVYLCCQFVHLCCRFVYIYS